MKIVCGDYNFVLETGDSIHYDGRLPHAVENAGTTTARIIITMSPAAFEPMTRVRTHPSAALRAVASSRG